MLTVAFPVVVAVVTFLAVTIGPLYVADRFRDTRRPTDAERSTLAELREWAGLGVERVAIIETGGDGAGDGEDSAAAVGEEPGAVAGAGEDSAAADSAAAPGAPTLDVGVRGPPGRRVLFVTEDVLAVLDADVAAALLAAEAGRLETYYNEFRAVAIAAVVAILATIVTTLVPFEAGFTALAAIGFVSFWVGRRVQYAADARAAESVGAVALADAFGRAATLQGVVPETGTWRTWFEVQPPLGDRIAALRGER
jgi:Zn-dependent protease with chaperone function